MVHFHGTDYRAHTSCISEAQKYQGHLYKEKDKKGAKGDRRKSMPGSFPDNSQAMVPRNAYVEDAPDGDDMNAVAVVDVPPRAPTPPPAHEALPENVNVFDFLVSEETPKGSRRDVQAPSGANMIEDTRHYANGDSQYSQYSNGDGSQALHYGFSYGNAPVQPGMDRYDSWQNMTESQQSQALMPPPSYVTPGPRTDRKEKHHMSERSDKKRKRQHVEELDLSASKRPTSRGDESMAGRSAVVGSGGRVLHSGLTGGLTRLVTDPEFFDDRIDAGPTPISPIKRTRREKDTKDERRKSSYASYSTVITKPSSSRHADEKHQCSRSKDRESQSSKHRHSKRRDSSSSADDRSRTTRKQYKAIEYSVRPERPASVQPSATNQLVSYGSRAELFMSFINKGPESERGVSINKALKRYHRERDVRGDEKDDEDKDLWKSLRLRRNDRGEIVLFSDV